MFERMFCALLALAALAAASPASTPAASTTATAPAPVTATATSPAAATATAAAPPPNKLKTFYSWKQLDWQFPSVDQRTQAIKSEAFIAAKANPLAFDLWKDKLFISVPRWVAGGVPSTVNYINITGEQGAAVGIGSVC